MSSKLGELYKDALKVYKQCKSNQNHTQCQQQFDLLWKECLRGKTKQAEKEASAESLLKHWQNEFAKQKIKNKFRFFNVRFS